MIMRAMFGGAITMAMMGFAQTAEQLIVIRAMQGLGDGTVSANNALGGGGNPAASRRLRDGQPCS